MSADITEAISAFRAGSRNRPRSHRCGRHHRRYQAHRRVAGASCRHVAYLPARRFLRALRQRRPKSRHVRAHRQDPRSRPTEATGAFLGGTVGYAFSVRHEAGLVFERSRPGLVADRALCRKNRRTRPRGIVAGLEPFIDTIVVCTLTALVILRPGSGTARLMPRW